MKAKGRKRPTTLESSLRVAENIVKDINIVPEWTEFLRPDDERRLIEAYWAETGDTHKGLPERAGKAERAFQAGLSADQQKAYVELQTLLDIITLAEREATYRIGIAVGRRLAAGDR
jgi:hypothetical protein